MPTPYRVLFAVVALLFGLAPCMSFALASARAEAAPAPACYSFDAVRAQLDKSGQEIAYIADIIDGTVLFIAVKPDTGEWMMFAQPTYDRACLLLLGKRWHDAPDSVRHPPGS